MVHQRQRLALSFKSGDDLPGVHTQLDNLERHSPSHGFLLFSHVDHTAATFANLLEEPVAPNTVASPFRRDLGAFCGWLRRHNQILQESPGRFVCLKKFFDALAKCRIAGAGPLEIKATLVRRQSAAGVKHRCFAIRWSIHGRCHILSSNAKNRSKKGETNCKMGDMGLIGPVRGFARLVFWTNLLSPEDSAHPSLLCNLWFLAIFCLIPPLPKSFALLSSKSRIS